MMFDSVREELATKITSGRLVKKTPQVEPATPAVAAKLPEPVMPVFKVRTPEPAAPVATRTAAAPITMRTAAASAPAMQMPVEKKAPIASAPVAEAAPEVPVAKPARRVETTDLNAAKTSPTLVGFQSKNPTVPEWRLQLQNAVQQRKGGAPAARPTAAPVAAVARVRTAAAPQEMALKAEVPVEAEAIPVPETADPRVANAMRRIAQSRQAFLEKETKPAPTPKPATPKVHRFDLNSTGPSISAQPSVAPTPVKPRLVATVPVAAPAPVPAPMVAVKRDTNKLPPIVLDRTKVAGEEEIVVEEISKPLPTEFGEIKRIRIAAEHDEFEDVDTFEAETEEIEDLAHVSMRFGAGLFDFIITSFIGLLLLSPVLFTRDGWFSPAGLLTFAGVTAVVMFLYMTVCLGFYGKTIGMRLFSLELVDAVENEYPTLHQAAVNSSVFILSLVFGGIGFLTMLFNEEKRAAHDLLSGTILVREF